MAEATLKTILQQLEEATGADRELDGDIWWAFLSADDQDNLDRTGYIRKLIEKDGSAGKALSRFYDSAANPPSKLDYAPSYTASIDAAIGLVPTERYANRRLMDYVGGEHEPIAWCFQMHDRGNQNDEGQWYEIIARGAATAPLAILTALVKAKIAEMEGV